MATTDTTEAPVADTRSLRKTLEVERVESVSGWGDALHVLDATFRQEKGWVAHPGDVFPRSDLTNPDVAWFLARDGAAPLGVTRVLFALPMDLYESYGFSLVEGGVDVREFVRRHRIAEVGRFAVVPEWRGNLLVAAQLMRAAATETVRRGYTHFITDVFEGEASSPFEFHRRILGFRVVATHEHGELAFRGRRLTLLLDLRDAYERLSRQRGWMFRFITKGWGPELVASLQGRMVTGDELAGVAADDVA